MPNTKTVHWNPPEDTHPKQVGKTRCGRELSSLIWRHDLQDTTCNACLRLAKKYDEAK